MHTEIFSDNQPREDMFKKNNVSETYSDSTIRIEVENDNNSLISQLFRVLATAKKNQIEWSSNVVLKSAIFWV
jgi:hypothetical protein